MTTPPTDNPPPPSRKGIKGSAAPIAFTSTVLLLITAVAMGLAGLNHTGDDTPPTTPPTGNHTKTDSDWFHVTRRSFQISITATGELESKNEVEIKCQVEGGTTIVDLIDEGASVAEGDVLVRLADDKIKDKIEQAMLEVEQGRADQVAAQQQLSIQQSEANSRIESAQLAVQIADLDLARWEMGTDPQKQRELNLELEKAKRNLVRAKRDAELSRQLYDEKFISLGELEDDQVAVIEAENTLATAQLDIDVYDSYTRPMERRRVGSALDQARAELDRTHRRNNSQLAQARALLQSKTRALRIRESKLEKLNKQFAGTVVKAPQAGLVVYATSIGARWRRQNPITQGREVSFNETMIVLPDTRRMVAALKVHESLLTQINTGQQGTVTIDARPDTPLKGTVSNIAVMAEDGGWMNPDLREYVVHLDLPDDADDTLRPSMRCSGRIMIDRAENVLAVPVQAVWSEGKQRYCYTRTLGGHARQRFVNVGRSSETYAEITGGLEEGDRVLLRKPRPGEAVDTRP